MSIKTLSQSQRVFSFIVQKDISAVFNPRPLFLSDEIVFNFKITVILIFKKIII
jgi:hypothetical protein